MESGRNISFRSLIIGAFVVGCYCLGVSFGPALLLGGTAETSAFEMSIGNIDAALAAPQDRFKDARD